MFKRVTTEEWMIFIPMLSFGIFFVVYLFVTLRALCLSRGERSRMASMALETDETTND